MLAQLKSVVLIKEAIKLVFRLVEYLEYQYLWVRLQDADLGRVPLSSVCVVLPILIFYFIWPV